MIRIFQSGEIVIINGNNNNNKITRKLSEINLSIGSQAHLLLVNIQAKASRVTLALVQNFIANQNPRKPRDSCLLFSYFRNQVPKDKNTPTKHVKNSQTFEALIGGCNQNIRFDVLDISFNPPKSRHRVDHESNRGVMSFDGFS